MVETPSALAGQRPLVLVNGRRGEPAGAAGWAAPDRNHVPAPDLRHGNPVTIATAPVALLGLEGEGVQGCVPERTTGVVTCFTTGPAHCRHGESVCVMAVPTRRGPLPGMRCPDGLRRPLLCLSESGHGSGLLDDSCRLVGLAVDGLS
jgi:hypothetical protein